MPEIVVSAMYRFVAIDDPAALRDSLHAVMLENGVKGTVLIAGEGINGAVAGSRAGVEALFAWLRADPRFAGIDCRESLTDAPPFARAKVRLKQEIVTMGVPGVDPTHAVGTYVEPRGWNALIDDPGVTLIDARNEYEVKVGTFRGAINPHTKSFRKFPGFVRQHLEPARHPKVAMFCTGGIRCEKATAYLKQLGFDDVYHLNGGILRYLDEIPESESAWEGECFVFDERVTVRHGLRPGTYDQCHACRMPISPADQQSDRYVRGESCPHCYDERTAVQRSRYRERERQVELAAERGEPHLGGEVAAIAQYRHDAKIEVRGRRRG